MKRYIFYCILCFAFTSIFTLSKARIANATKNNKDYEVDYGDERSDRYTNPYKDQKLELEYIKHLNLSYITFHERGERFVWVPEMNRFSFIITNFPIPIISKEKPFDDKSKLERNRFPFIIDFPIPFIISEEQPSDSRYKMEKFVDLIIEEYRRNKIFAQQLMRANISSIEDLIDRLKNSRWSFEERRLPSTPNPNPLA